MPRKATIHREDVFTAALLLIDAGGLKNLSMRRLGGELGVQGMSLYNHFENKEDLLQELHEWMLASIELPETTGKWREELQALGLRMHEVFAAHPQVLRLFVAQPLLTKSSLKLVEWVARALSTAIPQPLDRIYALHSFFAFVIGQSAAQLLPESSHTEILKEISPQTFPEITKLSELFEERSVQLEYELGLEALLDALESRKSF